MAKKKNKKNQDQERNEIITFIFVIIAAILGIITFIVTFNFGGIDEQIKCKKNVGYWCNKYEIEKMEAK